MPHQGDSNTLISTSLQLKNALNDETGSGAAVFANTPTLVTPVIGAATGTSLAASSGVAVGGATVGTSGVAFPAAAVAVADANTLDDYEENTYTPAFTNLTVVDGTGGASYSGTYTKVGRLVYFTAQITVTGTCTTASVNGSTYVSLPFTASPAAGSIGVADGNAANLSNGLIAGAVCYMPTWTARNVNIYIGGTFSI